MEVCLRKSRSIKWLKRKLRKTQLTGNFPYSKNKSCRRKGKDHTLALIKYWSKRRKNIKNIARSISSHILSQMRMPSMLNKMARCLDIYPVCVGVDKGSEGGDCTVIQSFNVNIVPCEPGRSPLMSCVVPLKQEEILYDNLVDNAVQRSISSEELFEGIRDDWKPVKVKNKRNMGG